MEKEAERGRSEANRSQRSEKMDSAKMSRRWCEMRRQECWCYRRPERRGEKRRIPCNIVLLYRVQSSAPARGKRNVSAYTKQRRESSPCFIHVRRKRRLLSADGVGQSAGLFRVSSLSPTLEGTQNTGHHADPPGSLTPNSGCRHSTTKCRVCYWALMTLL